MTLALIPGSFDPVTQGHLQIVRQAVLLFSHVRVVVAVHPTKETWFTLEERVQLFSTAVSSMPQVSVEGTLENIPDYAESIGARVIVRGIRGAEDAAAEQNLAALYRQMNAALSVVLLPAENAMQEISSTELKKRLMRGASLKDFCPRHVEVALRDRALQRQKLKFENDEVCS